MASVYVCLQAFFYSEKMESVVATITILVQHDERCLNTMQPFYFSLKVHSGSKRVHGQYYRLKLVDKNYNPHYFLLKGTSGQLNNYNLSKSTYHQLIYNE